MGTKPELLFYCQHSLGMGHLVRAFSLAKSLAKEFHVVFLNGGRFPAGITPPEEVDIRNLPPLGMEEDGHHLISLDEHYTLETAKLFRRQQILECLEFIRPEVVLIELFPFGRKKFAGELLPLLKAAHRMKPRRPLVMCSLRDIMMGARRDQTRHDERARWLADRYYDGVLVHSDPGFTRLEDSFKPLKPLQLPVHYTGFVTPQRAYESTKERDGRILVSAGGGIVGAPLFRAAIVAHRKIWNDIKIPMTLVAGPFLPESDWCELLNSANNVPGLKLLRSVPDLGSLLVNASASISQCGYNTAMDILSSGVPALAVPYSESLQDEQINRARRLEGLGLLRVLESTRLNGETLATEIIQLMSFRPNPVGLNLAGAANTVRLVRECVLATTTQRTAKSEIQAHMPRQELAGV
jgi:predicted glycosyltransferase